MSKDKISLMSTTKVSDRQLRKKCITHLAIGIDHNPLVTDGGGLRLGAIDLDKPISIKVDWQVDFDGFRMDGPSLTKPLLDG